MLPRLLFWWVQSSPERLVLPAPGKPGKVAKPKEPLVIKGVGESAEAPASSSNATGGEPGAAEPGPTNGVHTPGEEVRDFEVLATSS